MSYRELSLYHKNVFLAVMYLNLNFSLATENLNNIKYNTLQILSRARFTEIKEERKMKNLFTR